LNLYLGGGDRWCRVRALATGARAGAGTGVAGNGGRVAVAGGRVAVAVIMTGGRDAVVVVAAHAGIAAAGDCCGMGTDGRTCSVLRCSDVFGTLWEAMGTDGELFGNCGVTGKPCSDFARLDFKSKSGKIRPLPGRTDSVWSE
jgi:hypothetical protein